MMGPVTGLISTLKDLASQIAGVEAADCPAVIGILEQLKAQAWAKMVSQPATNGSINDGLLDMAMVAQQLNIPESRAYELARQGKLLRSKLENMSGLHERL